MAILLHLCALVACLGHGTHVYGYEPTTTPITTITPLNGCMYDGKIYHDQETIQKDANNCYGMYCMGGDVVSWDAACFFGTSPCAGINVDVPGQCCPECIETTTTATTTTPTTELPGCYVNGSYFEFGADIPQESPCKHCTCTRENGVMCSMMSCGYAMCVNPVKKKTDCCATCPNGPNCWYGKRRIQAGEIYKPKPNMECFCPEPWYPLATCRKLPSSKGFLKKKLKRQGSYMNLVLKQIIEDYIGSK